MIPVFSISKNGASVDKFQASFPVDSHKYSTAGLSYDVIIYQRGSTYHAAWFCKQCLSRTETGDCASPAQSRVVAEADIDRHQLHGHRGREAGG